MFNSDTLLEMGYWKNRKSLRRIVKWFAYHKQYATGSTPKVGTTFDEPSNIKIACARFTGCKK